MAYNEEGKIREYKPGWMAAELEEAVFETTQRHGAMVARPADRVRGDVGSKPAWSYLLLFVSFWKGGDAE